MPGLPNILAPLAHCRFEHIGDNGFPRVAILVNSERFHVWDEFVDHLGLKIASQRSYSQGIGLMIDFMAARSNEFVGDTWSYRRFFRVFADSLLLGTIQDGHCPYDLWWHGRTASGTKRMLRNVFSFLEWVNDDSGLPSVLPTRTSTLGERIKFWARWRIKKERSLLGHLKRKSQEREHARVHSEMNLPRNSVAVTDAPDRFPERYFRKLLNEGFQRGKNNRWTTVRDMLVLILLHGGGLRISEALSLWIDDVYPDPDDREGCIVRLYEPTEGTARYLDPATGKHKNISRKEYLQIVYNTVPRTMASGSQHLGSKPNLYMVRDEKYTLIFWRNSSYSHAFKALYSEYVMSRPRVTDHPYMIVSSGGTPMTRKGFEKVYAAAVRRIGLASGKVFGTSPQGHRHAYVYCLKSAGLPEKVVQIASHHRSAESQEVYNNASIQDARNAIQMAVNSEDSELLV